MIPLIGYPSNSSIHSEGRFGAGIFFINGVLDASVIRLSSFENGIPINCK